MIIFLFLKICKSGSWWIDRSIQFPTLVFSNLIENNKQLSGNVLLGQSVLELSLEGIEQQPWFLAAVIICAGGALWLLICVLIVCLYKHHNKQHAKYTSEHKKQIDLVTGKQISHYFKKWSHFVIQCSLFVTCLILECAVLTFLWHHTNIVSMYS